MVRTMDPDDDWLGLRFGHFKAVVGSFPNHQEFDPFTVAKVDGMVPLIDERSWDMHPEPRRSLRVGRSAPE